VIPPIEIVTDDAAYPRNAGDRCRRQKERTTCGLRHPIQIAVACERDQRAKKQQVQDVARGPLKRVAEAVELWL